MIKTKDLMRRNQSKYYSVQAKYPDSDKPITVSHTYDESSDEYYCEFLSLKDANAHMEWLMKENPNGQYRIVERTEIYKISKWSEL